MPQLELVRPKENPQYKEVIEQITELAGGKEPTIPELLDAVYAVGDRFLAAAEKHDWRRICYDLDWRSMASKEFDLSTKKILKAKP